MFIIDLKLNFYTLDASSIPFNVIKSFSNESNGNEFIPSHNASFRLDVFP